MKKFYFVLLLTLVFSTKPFISVSASSLPGQKILFCTLYNPVDEGASNSMPSIPRGPVAAPTVYLDEHTLILYTEFEEDIEVQLLDPDTMDDDEPTVVYSVNVPAGTQQVALPATCTGDYGIRLVVGQWYFVGTVCL